MQTHGSGPRRLRGALKRRGLTYRDAAKTLSLPAHFAHLHKVAQGRRPPDLALAIALERQLGIAVEDWPSLRQPVRELLKLRGIAA